MNDVNQYQYLWQKNHLAETGHIFKYVENKFLMISRSFSRRMFSGQSVDRGGRLPSINFISE